MQPSSFSNSAKFLHWSVAALIVTQYVLAKLAERAEHLDDTLNQLALLANHKSVGMTVLFLAIVRVGIRLTHKPPALPNAMPNWQKTASQISHLLLYGFLFALPVTGWLMSSAKAYSVSWFNLFAFPNLVEPAESLAQQLQTTHSYLADALVVVAVLHILAALKHHFLDKDDVLKRMAGVGSWALFIIVALLAISTLGRFITPSSETTEQITTVNSSNEAFQLSKLPLWNIDYSNSYIRFSGDQAGAPFSGEWQSWKADIQFDASALASARFDVRIAVDHVFSNDEERDSTIRSTEFFDTAQFPEATFQANHFKPSEQGYEALGQLTMKGFSSNANLKFGVNEVDGKVILDGTAVLDRLSWNIGSGDWADTSWVGQDVSVEVRVIANTDKGK